jgi:hypothetical protein
LRSDRRTGMEFVNGSVIEALPAIERTVRGFSVDLLIVDEAAGVPDHDYHGLLPTLAAIKGGQVLLSTPRGKRGFFSKLWHSDPATVAGSFEKTLITADMTPRITAEDLEMFRKSMPDRWFRQEFYCELLEADDAIFSQELVLGAVTEGVEALDFGEVGW